jgi:amino acid transporter
MRSCQVISQRQVVRTLIRKLQCQIGRSHCGVLFQTGIHGQWSWSCSHGRGVTRWRNGSKQEVGVAQWILTFSNPFGTINIMALIISAVSTALLLDGVEASKTVTNWMTAIKVALVVFMGLGGIALFQTKKIRNLCASIVWVCRNLSWVDDLFIWLPRLLRSLLSCR